MGFLTRLVSSSDEQLHVLTSSKILSPTCDNASANDAMIDRLAFLIEPFPGAPNRTRCFAHTLNLVAKSIMCQFDAPKGKKKKVGQEDLDSGFDALNALADELESDDTDGDVSDVEEVEEIAEIEEGPFNGREGMTADEISELERNVKPVQHVLVKVRKQLSIVHFRT